ncbi:ABC transporter permease [Pedobacter kyonggii]|uniref:FtsX-like permease family protein n=1 Tax=Pedobacter kyonggii TaxID=1926871 RepID=A0A4Q9HA09_9SPHI|nr:ABC transporter permease [Pedobacter kyonggii]TBO40860.1 FtsX-like permease family protein [Pedobacter kyonggii]
MFRLNLKIAFRNLIRNRSYTMINILGLSIGMTSCILIFVFIRFQLSYDTHFKNADRIYRFVTDWKYNNFDDYSAGVPIPFAPAAKQELEGIEKIARISRNSGVVLVRNGDGTEHFKAVKDVYFTEADLFDILQVKWLFGKATQSLLEPNTTVISEKTAKAFFGSAQQAIGKSFTFWNSIQLRVVGVIADMPSSSSIPLEIMISYPTFYGNKNQDWDSVSTYNECFVLLKPGASMAVFEQSLERMNDKYLKQKKLAGNQRSHLQALSDIHFSERYGNFAETNITKKEVYGLAIIGLFLMLTACINFINLATAQSVNRSKEVGVRKVMGAMRWQLVFQFLAETTTITVISVLLACIFSELMLPFLSHLFKGEVSLSLFTDPTVFIFLFFLVVVVSFVAGFYPAMIISGFSPALAIKNKVSIKSGNLSLRMILIVIQFSITIVLIVATVVVIRQMQYVRGKPLGFKKDAVVLLGFPGDSASMSRQQLFREKLLHVPGVEKQSYFVRPPLSGMMNTTNFYVDGRENKDFEVRLSPSDEHYFDLFGLQFLTGKVYAKSDTANAYIANETFVKKIGITNPQLALGKVISQNGRTGPIVGVVKDFNDQSLKEKISPMVFYQEKRQYYNMGLKLDPKQIIQTMKEIENLWKSSFPNEVYNAKFIDSDIDKYYESERITGLLFRIFAGVIMFISFIGLFGLVSFVAAQRTREMAIRKVLGATTLELVKMLNSSFIRMVFVANLIAWPLAYILANKWLSGFAYRTSMGLWPFMLAMATSMVITLITVSFRSYRAAKANAVDALKYE